ncbi:MAG TPA: DUF2976 domain-containing protein [Rhodobacteraceae bacterium]|nr:DUF2976 domain-containing protein [Paracoccaceae bacterium]
MKTLKKLFMLATLTATFMMAPGIALANTGGGTGGTGGLGNLQNVLPSGVNSGGNPFDAVKGISKSGVNVLALIAGALLFLLGAGGVGWAFYSVLSGRKEVSEVFVIGGVAAVMVAFGAYFLLTATSFL